MRTVSRLLAIAASLELCAVLPVRAQVGVDEVEVRFVQATPRVGFDRMTARVDGKAWYVSTKPLIHTTDIERIDLYAKGSTLALNLKLTEAGDRSLVQQSSTRSSSHIGLIVDGHLVEVWAIQGAFVGGSQSRVLSIGVDTTSMPPGSWRRLAEKWTNR